MADLDPEGYTNALVSHVKTLGVLDSVNAYEPKSAPGKGAHGALWLQEFGPIPEGSGLQFTTARVEYRLRIYVNMLADPQGTIDPRILKAAGLFVRAVHADYTLGGLCRNVDLLGMAGLPLAGRAGYIRQDDKQYRAMEITVPLLVNDVWEQAP